MSAISNNKGVIIEIDDCSYAVSVFDLDYNKVGCFKFKEVDVNTGSVLKLTWCYLNLVNEQYKRQGIGRHIIKLIKERYGLPIVAEDNDGIRKEDGSHLTGDAPMFIAKMRQEGLIEYSVM
ncbi:MAG: hypothetical protein HZB85_09585 [Deltaproteobacteria bacterium]|nr:hypothetical protein [Deltaproteobacteria bacterium]